MSEVTYPKVGPPVPSSQWLEWALSSRKLAWAVTEVELQHVVGCLPGAMMPLLRAHVNNVAWTVDFNVLIEIGG